jgi:hypothetical protein
LQVESYWQQCLRLPERIQEWQAYKAMKSYISQYLDVFPILHKLASKVKFKGPAKTVQLSCLVLVELMKNNRNLWIDFVGNS